MRTSAGVGAEGGGQGRANLAQLLPGGQPIVHLPFGGDLISNSILAGASYISRERDRDGESGSGREMESDRQTDSWQFVVTCLLDFHFICATILHN